jgi:hypothetical protein
MTTFAAQSTSSEETPAMRKQPMIEKMLELRLLGKLIRSSALMFFECEHTPEAFVLHRQRAAYRRCEESEVSEQSSLTPPTLPLPSDFGDLSLVDLAGRRTPTLQLHSN